MLRDIQDVVLWTVTINQIESQTDYLFVYNNKHVDLSEKVSVNVKNTAVSKVLSDIFDDSGIAYIVEGHNILLMKKPESSIAQQDEKRITGTVVDKKGETIVGANIVLKGAVAIGTITDIDGNFSILIPKDAVLLVSFIGYMGVEIQTKGRTEFNIVLSDDILLLDELVVIGYGTQRKASLTGSVGTLKGDRIKNTPSSNTIGILQGAIPGMVVSRTSGTPGVENWDFQIRGASSLNGSTPMLIIDDVPYSDYKRLSSINPNDIENISILKDAAAAIYGARAAGGVVLVTTKKGEESKPTISYSGRVSFKRPGIMQESTSRREYALMIDEGNKNDKTPAGVAVVEWLRDWEYWMNGYKDANGNDLAVAPGPVGDCLDYTYSDQVWKDILFGNAVDHSHNISISGKGDKYRYFSSVGYNRNNGLVQGNENHYERLNVRVTGDYQVHDKLNVEVALALEDANRIEPTMLARAMGYPSTVPVLTMGNSAGQPYAFGGIRNPYIQIRDGGLTEEATTNYNAKMKFVYQIINDLKLTGFASRSLYGYNTTLQLKPITWYMWEKDAIWANDPSPAGSEIKKSNTQDLNVNYSAYLNYDKEIKDHRFGLMAGGSYEQSLWEYVWTSRKALLNTEIPSLNMGSTSEQYNGDEYKEWIIGSLFGRFNYSYKNKYLLDANVRYDGSSRFADGKRWDLFGGVSAGWVVSQENFMEDIPVDFLKLRASYGSLGNQNGIGLYDYLTLINLGADTYPLGETGSKNGITTLGSLASTSRTWERVNSINVGIDVSILDNRLSVNYDYFWKKNPNMLIPVIYPSILGSTAPSANLGVLDTWGWEATVQWRDKIGQVGYHIGLNISDNQNELTDLNGSDNVNSGLVKAREGYPINSIFGYKSGGIMKTQEEVDEYIKMSGTKPNLRVGDLKFLDVSGDGKLSPFPDKTTGDSGDLIYLGNTNIRYSFAVNAGLDWKGFDFSLMIQGVLKKGELLGSMPGAAWWGNQEKFIVGKPYHPTTNPGGTFPALSTSWDLVAWDYQASTFSFYNNSYARLKNITLGYTLPKSLLSKWNIGNIRVYFSGDDLFEIISYDRGKDPEGHNGYPFPRYCSFGVDLTF